MISGPQTLSRESRRTSSTALTRLISPIKEGRESTLVRTQACCASTRPRAMRMCCHCRGLPASSPNRAAFQVAPSPPSAAHAKRGLETAENETSCLCAAATSPCLSFGVFSVSKESSFSRHISRESRLRVRLRHEARAAGLDGPLPRRHQEIRARMDRLDRVHPRNRFAKEK